MPTHPLADPTAKERIIRRIVDLLLGRVSELSSRTAALVCAAYAANVLENAFVTLNDQQREMCFRKCDELMQEFANHSDRAKAAGATEVMAGVLNVYMRMDALL